MAKNSSKYISYEKSTQTTESQNILNNDLTEEKSSLTRTTFATAKHKAIKLYALLVCGLVNDCNRPGHGAMLHIMMLCLYVYATRHACMPPNGPKIISQVVASRRVLVMPYMQPG